MAKHCAYQYDNDIYFTIHLLCSTLCLSLCLVLEDNLKRQERLSCLISFINNLGNCPCLWNYKRKDKYKIDVIYLTYDTFANELEGRSEKSHFVRHLRYTTVLNTSLSPVKKILIQCQNVIFTVGAYEFNP